MTLQMHSDAAYLVAPKARSCVMSSAAKSIVIGIFMFMNVQEDVLILQ